MRKFKVGDIVKIKSYKFLADVDNQSEYSITEDMASRYHDMIAVITKFDSFDSNSNCYRLNVDDGRFFWCEECLRSLTFSKNDEIQNFVMESINE